MFYKQPENMLESHTAAATSVWLVNNNNTTNLAAIVHSQVREIYRGLYTARDMSKVCQHPYNDLHYVRADVTAQRKCQVRLERAPR